MDEFLKRIVDEYGDRSISITLNDLGMIMGRNITKVVSIDDLMTSNAEELAVHVALLELLIKFCSSLMEDMIDSDKLEIEDDTNGGKT